MEDLIREFEGFYVANNDEYARLKQLFLRIDEPYMDNEIYAKANYYLREICFDMGHPEYIGVDKYFKTTVGEIEKYLRSCICGYHHGNQAMGRECFKMAAKMILNFFK